MACIATGLGTTATVKTFKNTLNFTDKASLFLLFRHILSTGFDYSQTALFILLTHFKLISSIFLGIS